MQHSLTTATPFKSQKILFKPRALGSNLIHRRLSTSQLPILDPPPPQLHDLLCFSPLLPPIMGSPRASRGSAMHVFLVWTLMWPASTTYSRAVVQVKRGDEI